MDFLELVKERYSVRDYIDRPIEKEKMDRVLEAGMVAPTGANRQPQRIYVIKNEEKLAKLRGMCRSAFNAPVVLVFTYNKNEQWKNRYDENVCAGQQDVSIVATQMMLEAWELGIGSCWVNGYDPAEIRAFLELPEDEELVLLMDLGYPGPGAVPSPLHAACRPLEEVVKEL